MLVCGLNASGLTQDISRHTLHGDVLIAGGRREGMLSLAAYRDWIIGKRGRWEIGFAGRYTGYLGANQHYITAPARLTSGTTGPVVLFKENIAANIDTFLIKSPQVNALNFAVNFTYRFAERWRAGFDIDLIGVSFGGRRRGNYINGYFGKMGDGRPTPFNILLVSDNDRGTLNSEFYIKYSLNPRWGIKGGMEFLFTEYTTDEPLQQFPRANDRFRNKSFMPMIGISHNFFNP